MPDHPPKLGTSASTPLFCFLLTHLVVYFPRCTGSDEVLGRILHHYLPGCHLVHLAQVPLRPQVKVLVVVVHLMLVNIYLWMLFEKVDQGRHAGHLGPGDHHIREPLGRSGTAQRTGVVCWYRVLPRFSAGLSHCSVIRRLRLYPTRNTRRTLNIKLVLNSFTGFSHMLKRC